jgi:hypothetical protein
MMCLGWNNQETCKTRGQEVIDTRTEQNGCETPWWFWIGAAVVAVGAIVRGNR